MADKYWNIYFDIIYYIRLEIIEREFIDPLVIEFLDLLGVLLSELEAETPYFWIKVLVVVVVFKSLD